MPIINNTLVSGRLSWIVFLLFALQAVEVLSGFTDVPRKCYSADLHRKCSLKNPCLFQLHQHARNNFILAKNSNVIFNLYVHSNQISHDRNIFHVQVHEYYAIIGRPRFGRSLDKLLRYNHDFNDMPFIDMSNEHIIIDNDYHDRLEE
jgi:hypothetical protein